MKKSLILVGMLAVGYANAQQGNVGINTETPQATMEIVPSKTNLEGTTNEGIIIPKLTKARVLAIATDKLVEGTKVYVTDEVTADDTQFVGTGKGFYFYNGTKWVKQLDSDNDNINIYNADGTLISDRVVNLDGKTFTLQDYKGNSTGLRLDTSPNTYSTIRFMQEGQPRWDIGKTRDEETGNNTGSNFYITSGADNNGAGTRRLTIIRHTGNVGIGTMNPIAKLDISGNSAQIAGRYFHRTTVPENVAANVKSIITVRDVITDGQGTVVDAGTELQVNRTYEIVLNHFSNAYHTGSKYIVYYDSIKKEWVSKLVSSANVAGSARLGIASSGNEIEVWHEHSSNIYAIRANIMSIQNYSTSGTSAYNFGLDGAMTNLAGNVGVGTEAPTEKLDVDGNIKATSLAGTGNRNVYADANGVLKVGEAAAGATTVGSTDNITCNADNVGKINYGDITLSDGRKVGAFGFCMKGADASNTPTYGWKYLYGIEGVTSGSGTFGSGINE